MYKVLVDGALLCDSRIDELAIISPVVKLQANSAGSFSFTIAPEHPNRKLIKRRTSIISVFIDNSIEPTFQGIVVDETTDFFNQTTFSCEGELSYLNDSIQRQAKYTSLTVRQLLETYINSHNSQVEESKRFTVGMVTVSDSNNSISCFTNMNSTMQEIKEDLLEDLGGYIRVRYADGKKYIDYLAESPYTSNQVIELGKNLLDYESNIDNTEIATSIIPLGAKLETQTVQGLDAYVDIKSVNSGKDYVYSEIAVQNYGWITKVVNWDDVTTPTALLAKANKYLAETQFENVVLKVSAVDFGLLASRFDRFNVLDKIRVVSAPHGMDKYFILTEQTLNLNEPEKDTVILGSAKKLSLTANSNQANANILKRIEQAPTSSMMESAIANATALLAGSKGGYVKTKLNADGEPIAILIMDTNDEDTATRMWRWNEAGLGYGTKKDGVWTYATALTKDGHFVTDAVTVEGLEVGKNVVMGDGAKITWQNVTNQPTISSNITTLYYLTGNSTAPSAPTSEVTRSTDVSEYWTQKEPTHQDGYVLYMCQQIKNTDGTFSWTTVHQNITTEITQDSIKTATITCDQIKGNALTLGGNNNANGVLYVNNNAGERIGAWTNNGLQITNRVSRSAQLTDGAIKFGDLSSPYMMMGLNTWSGTSYKGVAFNAEYVSKFLSIGFKKSSGASAYDSKLLLNNGLNPTVGSATYKEDVIIFGKARITADSNGAALETTGTISTSSYDIYVAYAKIHGWDGKYLVQYSLSDGGNCWGTNGNFIAQNYLNHSDRRLKKNIEDVGKEYCKLIDVIQPQKFDYKSDGTAHIGFIAQDVEKACEELDIDSSPFVNGSEDSVYAMSMNDMVAVLWKGLQDARKRISELEEKLNERTD